MMEENLLVIKIRKAVRDDAEALCLLLRDLFLIETDFIPDAAKQRKGLEMLIGGMTGGVIFAAESGSEIAGMVNLQKIVSTAAGGYSVLLEDLYVKPEYRNSGIGSKLIDRAVQWGKQEGALRIQLAADLRNRPAISFYSERGFHISNMVLHYKVL